MLEPSCAARNASRSSSSCAVRFRAAASEQVAGQIGETFLAGGVEIIAGADVNHDVDQRQFAVRHNVGNRAGFERHSKIRRVGRFIVQRRERKFFRPVGNRRGLGIHRHRLFRVCQRAARQSDLTTPAIKLDAFCETFHFRFSFPFLAAPGLRV